MITQQEKLKTAIATGNDHKAEHGFGKEYYALYTGHMPDAILVFIADKMAELYPNLNKNSYISVPGVVFHLFDCRRSIFLVIDEYLYIHKASFKRHLKKAICHSRVKL